MSKNIFDAKMISVFYCFAYVCLFLGMYVDICMCVFAGGYKYFGSD